MEENHFNCIYLYTNKVNGKKYVGQAVDFIRRHKQHIKQAYNENCRAYNQYFHRAIRKYGIENFEIEILKENLLNQEELNYWECYYIIEFDTLANNGKGYNLASGGSNGNPLAGKTDKEMKEIGRKWHETMNNKSEEEIAEIGRKWHETMNNKSEEEIAEIGRKKSEAHKGLHHSEETRAKISEANKGKNPYAGKTEEEMKEISRKHSETWQNKSDEEIKEIGRKISEANKGKNNGMYGKHHTEETKAKISEAKKGKYKGEKAPRTRKVVLVDPFTKLPVFIWQYVKQASEFYNICNTTLDYYLKGKRKTGHEYNGFLWYYLDEWEQLTN